MTGSPPDFVMREWRRGSFRLVTSQPLLDELTKVLSRPKISRRTRLSPSGIHQLMLDVSAAAIVVAPREALSVIPSAADDDRLFEAAIEGETDYIVSGDRRVLNIESFQRVEIVTPMRFMAVLHRNAG